MEKRYSDCPCLENGVNGRKQHSESSNRRFVNIEDYNNDKLHTDIVEPCTNHVYNYLKSRYFREIIEGEKI